MTPKIGSRHRYRARFFRRIIVSSPLTRRNKARAARDAGDLPIPTVSCRKEKRHESCSHHGFRVFPERPAHGVLGLLRTNPGGLTWPSLLRTGRSLSTAGRGPTPDAPYLGYERPRPEYSPILDNGQVLRRQTAWISVSCSVNRSLCSRDAAARP